MPIRPSKPVEPSFQPTGSCVGSKPGWGCDELHMPWENAEAGGRPGFEEAPDGGAEILFMLRTIAVFQAIKGHYEDAERIIGRSLEISKKTLGWEHPEATVSLKVFAQVIRMVRRDLTSEMA